MTDAEKISLLEDTIGLDGGTIEADTKLETIEMWDSVGKLFLLSTLKKEFGRDIDPALIRKFKTVREILLEMHR
jgi:acyl carrier protein